MALIKMASVAMPTHYVRGKLNGKNIADLMDLVFKANAKFAKDKDKGVLDYKELKGKKLIWPFNDPIIVAKNPEPEIKAPLKDKAKGVKKEGKGKKSAKVFKANEIIDGNHRFTVWRKLGQKEIEANIKNIPNAGERFLQQYSTNAAHGLRLDKDARDNAVMIGHNDLKISLSVLAEKTGLDRSSIIRILQRKRGVKPPKREGKGEFTANQATMAELTASGFVERVETLYSNFDRLEKEIISFLTANVTTKGKSKLGSIVATLKRMAVAFEIPLKETALKVVPKKDEVVGNLPPGSQLP